MDPSVLCMSPPSLLQNLRQQVLELLGPISMNHGAHFMAAIAYVWNERKHTKAPVRNKVSKRVGLTGAADLSVLIEGFCSWLL